VHLFQVWVGNLRNRGTVLPALPCLIHAQASAASTAFLTVVHDQKVVHRVPFWLSTAGPSRSRSSSPSDVGGIRGPCTKYRQGASSPESWSGGTEQLVGPPRAAERRAHVRYCTSVTVAATPRRGLCRHPRRSRSPRPALRWRHRARPARSTPGSRRTRP